MKLAKKLTILMFIVFGLLFAGTSVVHASNPGVSNVEVKVTSVFDQENPNIVTNINAVFGSTLSISPTGRTDFRFAYWVVNGVVRQDLPYETEFRITSKLSLVAVFSPEDFHTVLFMDANGDLLATRFITDGGTAVEPNVSLISKPGLTFGSPKWKTMDGATSLVNITSDTVFVLQYQVSSEATFDVLVENGLGAGNYAYNQIVTVTKDPLETDYFDSWTENGQVVSTNPNYKFSALKNRTLVANYSETEPIKAPVVYFSGNLGLRNDFQTYVGQIDIPENYQVIEYGFLIHPSNNTQSLTIDTANVISAIASKIHPVTKEFMMSFPANSHQSARAYVLLENSGEYTYFYSPQTFQPSVVPVTRVVLYDGISQLKNDETFDFNATVSPANSNQRVTWSVNDLTKATIDKNGVLTPILGQTGTITVTATSVSNPAQFASYSVQIINDSTTVTLVSNYQELVSAVNGSATYIKLTQNINALGQTFTPTRTNFSGIFDGQGFAIIDLNINGGSNQNTGLFRQIGGNAVIKDVTFINPIITTSQANSGLIAGSINSNGTITIRDVYVINLITNLTSAQWTHGGLIGAIFNTNHLRIFNTSLEHTYNAPSGGANYGGAVGVVNNGSSAIVHVAHSSFDVKINGTSTGGIYSAVIGQVNGTTGSRVDSVYASIRNTGATNVLSNAGLIYGQLNTAGTNHFISRVLYPSATALTRAFGQNNGSSQVNGTTSNTNAALTSQVSLVSQALAMEFISRNSIWTYNDGLLSLNMDHIQDIFDNNTADRIIEQIAIPNANAIYSNITLQTLILDAEINWSSSHPSIISTDGTVTRPIGGNQNVTMTYDFSVGNVTRNGQIELTVIEAYDGITPILVELFGPTSIYQGQTSTLTFEVTPITIEPKITWSVLAGGEAVLSINQAGVITALLAGEATVRATLVSDPTIFGEYEITVLASPSVEVTLVGDGLVINEPANSQVYVNVNMPGTLYYVQNATTQTPQQIISSGSKQTVIIENPGVTQIGVSITSGTKLQFVFVLLDGSTVVANSTTFELTFTLLLPTVFVSNYSELVTALNRADDINIKLTQNITATGTFTSTKTSTFVGTFDGQGYKISNLSITATHQNSGLFRQIGGNAVFKDIVFESPRLTTNQANSALLAGRVAVAGNMLISNVIVTDFVQTITANQWTHGGLIGTINTNSVTLTVENVYLEYKVQTTSSSVSTGNIGGIVGVQSNTSTLIVRHTLIDMQVSFENTGNTGQIIAAVTGQINSGTTTNTSYLYARIKNTGAANAIANAGIVFSQMNNAGSNHTVTSVVVMPSSDVTKLTNNYNTAINGGNNASHANIISQFHGAINETLGNAFVTERSQVWSYDVESNILSFIIPV
jgi:hypothetical protein